MSDYTRCLFRLHRTHDEWMADQVQILFTWGIFNPNGPTLYCIGTRDTGARGETEVFFRWMHFLGGKNYCLGYINGRGDDSMVNLMSIVMATAHTQHTADLEDVCLFSALPSFFFSVFDNGVDSVLRRMIGESQAVSALDWGREEYYLDKYGHDLFGRAGEETREALEQMRQRDGSDSPAHEKAIALAMARHEHLETFRQWAPNAYVGRGIADGDVERWWEKTQSTEYAGAAIWQFAQAWVGASQNSGGLPVVTAFEEVRDFLIHAGVPLWPSEVSSDALL